MYKKYWNFLESPFSNRLDPEVFYWSPSHEDAAFRLLYFVKELRGTFALTGVPGTGKTFLARIARTRLEEKGFRVVHIPVVDGDPEHFLSHLLETIFDVQLSASVGTLFNALQSLLLGSAEEFQGTILFIEDAHDIDSEPLFRILRAILEVQNNADPVAKAVLVGAPSLLQKASAGSALSRILRSSAQLQPLNFDQMREFLRVRLDYSEYTQALFEHDALKRIHHWSGGIPRLVNVVCDAACSTAFTRNQRIIPAATVDAGAAELPPNMLSATASESEPAVPPAPMNDDGTRKGRRKTNG